jgi:Fur family transcriptional regulator, peroxide stress response regulator
MQLKYSRQREAIKDFLSTRKDHPTADIVYMNVKMDYPNISLGTVYRNLTLLADTGEIARIQVGDKTDHFDPNTVFHNHFVCTNCGKVLDLDMKNSEISPNLEIADFDGRIDGQVTYFYGLCNVCMDKN